MFIQFLLLGIALVLIVFIFNYLLPKVIQNYRLYRELKLRKQRQAFKLYPNDVALIMANKIIETNKMFKDF